MIVEIVLAVWSVGSFAMLIWLIELIGLIIGFSLLTFFSPHLLIFYLTTFEP
jgi:hypothetical protein